INFFRFVLFSLYLSKVQDYKMIKKFSVCLFLGVLSFSHVYGLSPIKEEETPPRFNANLYVSQLQLLLEREEPDLDEIQIYCSEKNKQFSQVNQPIAKLYFELEMCFMTEARSTKEHYGPLLEELRRFHNWSAEGGEAASQTLRFSRDPSRASLLDTPRDSFDSQGSQSTLTSLEKKEGLDELIERFGAGLMQGQYQGQQVDIKLFFSNSVTPKIRFIKCLERGYNIHCLDRIFEERDFIVLRADALGLVDSTLPMQSIIVQIKDYFRNMPSLQAFNITKASGEKEKFPREQFLEEIISFFKDFEEDSISQKLASGVWGLALEIDKKVNKEGGRMQTKGATEISLAILRSYIMGRDARKAETYPERVGRLFVAYLETLQYKFETMNFEG
ncbi:MAG TPA: hypothetical protein PLY23_01560, partial [Alphaproteobacteria bacterium]|nr:hypothetical protein [Alphaproteobacteria bacterium]HQS93316.1 hypothetical protein [Alphaproteobacteria bacterium]